VIHNPRPLPSAEGDYSFPPVYGVLALLRDLAFTVEYYNINRLPGGKQLHSEVRYFQAHARRMLQNLAPQHRAKVDRLAQWEALDNGEERSEPDEDEQSPADRCPFVVTVNRQQLQCTMTRDHAGQHGFAFNPFGSKQAGLSKSAQQLSGEREQPPAPDKQEDKPRALEQRCREPYLYKGVPTSLECGLVAGHAGPCRNFAPGEHCSGTLWQGNLNPRLPCLLVLGHEGPCKFVP
jgi:hypothetical protein